MEKIGTIEKLHENEANQVYKIQYTEALGLEGGDRQVAYPVEFDMQRIADSVQADLQKTRIIESKEKRKEQKANFYREIKIQEGEILAEHTELTYQKETQKTEE